MWGASECDKKRVRSGRFPSRCLLGVSSCHCTYWELVGGLVTRFTATAGKRAHLDGACSRTQQHHKPTLLLLRSSQMLNQNIGSYSVCDMVQRDLALTRRLWVWFPGSPGVPQCGTLHVLLSLQGSFHVPRASSLTPKSSGYVSPWVPPKSGPWSGVSPCLHPVQWYPKGENPAESNAHE